MNNIKLIKLSFLALSFMILMFSCKTESEDESAKNSSIDVEIADTNLILPPAWAFGVLYGGYTNQELSIATIKEIKQHDYPIDAYWIDSWFWSFDDHGRGPKKYLDFVADTIAYPNREGMWGFMEQNHIKGGFWVWDCILESGNEAAYNEFDSLGYFSSKYLNTNPWHNNSTTTAMFENGGKHPGTMCGIIDFNNPDAVALFKHRMKHFFDEGADFLKLDRTSNLEVVKAIFEMSQELGKETKGRGFTLSHSGGTDTEEFKRYPTKWTDDTRSDWSIESPTKEFNTWVPKVALKENIAMFTDPAIQTSKIPFLTNDTGGFDMGITDKVDEELYIRWVQFSAFNPIMEVFSQPENYTKNLAFNYSERADSIFKRYSHLRMELFPYIYSKAIATRVEGKGIIQSLNGNPYNYYFGDEMVVAPVYEHGATTRSLTLPKGNWVNFWTGELVEGVNELVVDAPIDQIPVFVMEGSIVPMRAYSRSIETGSNETIYLHIFPGKDGEFKLYEDDGATNDYLQNIFALTTIELVTEDDNSLKVIVHPTKGSYNNMPKKRYWQLIIHSEKNYSEAIAERYNAMKLTRKGSTVESGIFDSQMNQSLEIIINLK